MPPDSANDSSTYSSETGPVSSPSEPVAPPDAESLSQISGAQWKSGIAAWLGWMFDGLDQHIYTLAGAPFVAELVHVANTRLDPVPRYGSYIQAAFLVGWALGGGFFGRLGDHLGRARALSLTILTFAVFTGLSFFAHTWWQLMIFRFLAALGIGGEWAVGSSLLSETWPRKWRPWLAAVLQTGVNIGVMIACLLYFCMAGLGPRPIFLVGVAPAFLVWWIRKSVPESHQWTQAKASNKEAQPGLRDLFRGKIAGITLRTIVVCACTLTAWWAFMFWNPQHLRNLPETSGWALEAREKLVSTTFFTLIALSCVGNFVAGALARKLGYRFAIAIMCAGFFLAMMGTYYKPRTLAELKLWLPWVGFFSGVLGLFTMFLPPLFPVLLRTTGAGFSYNVGRIAAAAGTIFFGLFTKVGDFRTALFWASFLFLPAMIVALTMSEPRDT